uniref:T9SS type A sorting domain-containing protein n=1 Tax=Ignavibacterium sp. TaxID=2651167 RepID=UPI00307F835A
MIKCFIILIIVLNTNIFSQEGVLDPTFGNAGIVSLGFNVILSNDIAQCIDIQSDGKIVVAGYSENKIALARLNTNGTLDNTFGTAGKVTTNIYSGGAQAYDVKIQNDGKIVICGVTWAGAPSYPSYFTVVRYNSDGTLDNTFNGDGKFIGDFSSIYNYAFSMAIQIDGRILVAGETLGLSNNSEMAVIRLKTDGTLDDTFGTGGKVKIAFPNANASASFIGIKFINLFNQKIVIGGTVTPDGSDSEFSVVQLNLSGSLDNNFGSGGIVRTDLTSNFESILDCIIQQEEKILAVGNSNFSSIAIVRYNSDGSLDNTFSGDGKVITSLGEWSNAHKVVLQNNNRIITLGNYVSGNQRDILMVRYNTNGSLDYTFGNNGYITTSVSDTSDVAMDAAFQSDGKLVVAGYSFDSFGSGNFVVLRYIISSNLVSVEEEGEIPTEFKLEQNYPNPFNPSTKIKYTIPDVRSDLALTVLKVYDILGNEVVTLVNDYKPAGSYEVEFNASNLSSGIYFYK